MSNMEYCRGCGKEIHESAGSCPHCGARARGTRSGGKDKKVAGVLAIFLGALGIHRFYLGQWWGIFYLLVSLTLLLAFIPAIVAFVEGIVFLVCDDEEWAQKYG